MSSNKSGRLWIIYSILMVVSTGILSSFYLSEFLTPFHVWYLIIVWSQIFVYVLMSALREYPEVAIKFREKFSKIKNREVYEGLYFLFLIGLIFVSFVIVVNILVGESWAIASFVVLFGFYLAIIRDILKNKRETKS